ncbi:MAG: hypothetical protein Q7S29_02525 [Candidatus Peribacter sp.]|nr:hypothetical protein [Candidatus Peribacter sp.]
MDATERHHRRSIRLRNHAYTHGSYFLTIGAEEREWLFGEIRNGKMILNEFGKIVEQCWKDIPLHFHNTRVDAHVVMPNHIHGILHLRTCTDTTCRGRTSDIVHIPETSRVPTQRSFQRASPGTLSTIIGSFKSAVTRRINLRRRESGAKVWQRNFHEHIVRNAAELAGFRIYIRDNPEIWKRDQEYFPR